MANALGTATLDFGAAPGSNEAQVSVADTSVGAGSYVESWISGNDSTADHTAADHRYLAAWIGVTAEAVAGVGLTIYGRSEHKIEGLVAVRYVWSD